MDPVAPGAAGGLPAGDGSPAADPADPEGADPPAAGRSRVVPTAATRGDENSSMRGEQVDAVRMAGEQVLESLGDFMRRAVAGAQVAQVVFGTVTMAATAPSRLWD